uniref:Cytoskeleton-associated protein 4 n=1 Tax=Electrophorus electricus TaxID=8005 RepID=A0A4W4H578_ELEEL
MPTRNRNKNTNSNDKNLANHQDDVAKKSPKISKADCTPVSSSRSGSGKFSKFLTALCYFGLIAGVGFASFYLQQVLSEVDQISLFNGLLLVQVNAMSSSVERLEAAVGRAQADLEDTNRALRKGEVETRRVEEVLQKLQNEILRDLSEGIREVKEAREHDFSSLERTLEERLAELSRSISDSVAEFAEAQGEAQAQLSELRAKMEEHSEPGLLKHELLSITTAMADLHTANEVAEGNMGVLREQIVSVGMELQTRNKEVASLSEEIEAVRSLVQSTAGQLRQEVSAAKFSMQDMSDRVQSLQDGQHQASESFQSFQMELRGELAKVEKRGDDLEVRLKAVEDNTRDQVSSAAEQASRLEALLYKYDSHESVLAAQGQAAEKVKQVLKEELEGLRSSMGELQAHVATLEDTNSRLEATEANTSHSSKPFSSVRENILYS